MHYSHRSNSTINQLWYCNSPLESYFLKIITNNVIINWTTQAKLFVGVGSGSGSGTWSLSNKRLGLWQTTTDQSNLLIFHNLLPRFALYNITKLIIFISSKSYCEGQKNIVSKVWEIGSLYKHSVLTWPKQSKDINDSSFPTKILLLFTFNVGYLCGIPAKTSLTDSCSTQFTSAIQVTSKIHSKDQQISTPPLSTTRKWPRKLKKKIIRLQSFYVHVHSSSEANAKFM